ncbi:MAG: DUF309 domain-containing protein [Chloroherpetonaceae bacterium]|nr:DUF309 domain-containing protein [Chloroherpetonaceae bacterium]MCS7211730.1 DUF309 domain-containing protein [Chloroherpetonaceae bacterium]MDW8018726.1 DUF309 domain-containing protein [Chloroherpetonaceae bacterium]MDW8465910.1 DUF309 domain-containing protein [Chloroherpetonaceae bacterium]
MKTRRSAPRKRLPEEIQVLREPQFSDVQRQHFLDGIDKFNRQAYWDAHESWEHVWQEMTEDAEIVLRGLVQLAAALHCLQTNRLDCAARNFQKAYPKLSLAPDVFLGIDIKALRTFIEAAQHAPYPSPVCRIEFVSTQTQ